MEISLDTNETPQKSEDCYAANAAAVLFLFLKYKKIGENQKGTGRILTIIMPCELDHHNAEKLKTGADKIIQSKNIRSIVFDFGKTNFMDSSGIGMIMGRYKMIRFMGGKVIAIRANQRIRRILTLSGVYKVMDIYEGLPKQSEL